MIKLSTVTIQEFKQIIKEEYGRTITDQETYEIVTSLVGYFDLLAKIDHRNQLNKEKLN